MYHTKLIEVSDHITSNGKFTIIPIFTRSRFLKIMYELVGLLLILFIVSFLYSSIGHGGASGYIAVLSIIGMSNEIIRPSALVLNVFVASISFFQYYRGGHFRWKLFYPFALLSVPMAFAGSFIELDATWYKRIVGICLILAVLRILGMFNPKDKTTDKKAPIVLCLLIGAGLGFLSGMIGIGGGIILSPIILIFGWGNLKEAAAVSALFIVLNSMAGLLGLWNQEISWPPQLLTWGVVVVIGGFLGAYWGSKKAQNKILKNVLAVVLLFAAFKLIFI
jgi:uncharacterized membrane protein YfcA